MPVFSTFDASTPALAQMKPWCVSQIITPCSMRTMRFDSRSTTSIWRASFSNSRAYDSANGDGVTVSRSTMRPSAFETIFCVTTSTSPSSIATPVSRAGGDDHRRQVVAGVDLRYALEADDADFAHVARP